MTCVGCNMFLIVAHCHFPAGCVPPYHVHTPRVWPLWAGTLQDHVGHTRRKRKLGKAPCLICKRKYVTKDDGLDFLTVVHQSTQRTICLSKLVRRGLAYTTTAFPPTLSRLSTLSHPLVSSPSHTAFAEWRATLNPASTIR